MDHSGSTYARRIGEPRDWGGHTCRPSPPSPGREGGRQVGGSNGFNYQSPQEKSFIGQQMYKAKAVILSSGFIYLF